jgi:hypothetical protein
MLIVQVELAATPMARVLAAMAQVPVVAFLTQIVVLVTPFASKQRYRLSLVWHHSIRFLEHKPVGET